MNLFNHSVCRGTRFDYLFLCIILYKVLFMENKKTNNSKYLVPKGTTHLMMWIGGVLPTERIVQYNKICASGKDCKYEYEDIQKRHEVTVVGRVKTLDGGIKEIEAKGKKKKKKKW